MSCEISITTQIHPITEKILKGELKLSEVTLEQFREGREVYPTASQAKKKGFEAHHVNPISAQYRKYNEEHDTNFKGRAEFMKNVHDFDDRCIRYTPFEHIIDHILMAKEDKRHISSFERYAHQSCKNMSIDELDFINACVEYADVVKEIHKDFAERNKGNHYHTGHKHSEETRKKMSEAAKHRPKRTFSEESKKKMSEIRKGWKPSEETRKKMSEAKKGKPTWNKGLKGKYHSSKNNESN